MIASGQHLGSGLCGQKHWAKEGSTAELAPGAGGFAADGATHWSPTACLQKCGPGSEGAKPSPLYGRHPSCSPLKGRVCLWRQVAWVQIPPLPLTSSFIFGRCFKAQESS